MRPEALRLLSSTGAIGITSIWRRAHGPRGFLRMSRRGPWRRRAISEATTYLRSALE